MPPLSTLTAGFIAVLVGYTGSAAIIFQAAQSAGASQAMIASWMGALGIAMGLTTIGLSLRYRAPVITAWSTPGAAILVVALVGVDVSQAIGAFLFCAVLILLFGITGWFEKLMSVIPISIASALLAGVLARFGMDVFVMMESDFVLVLLMFLTYLVFKRLLPVYSIIIVFGVSILVSYLLGGLETQTIEWKVTEPVWVTPVFDWQVLVGVGIPLFIVTMASQNVPGVTVLKTSGYDVPVSPVISWTGVATFLLAPFGCFAINLAAITAAICTGESCHPDKDKRFYAGLSAGTIYILSGIFAASIVSLFAAFPKAMVLALAGIALFSTIANSLQVAMSEAHTRDPAIITFLITLSGMNLFGIGSAFWALIGGGLAMLILNFRSKA